MADQGIRRALVGNNVALLLQYVAASVVPLLLIPFFVKRDGLHVFGGLAIALALGNLTAVVVQYASALWAPPLVVNPPHGETAGSIVGSVMRAKFSLATCLALFATVVHVSAGALSLPTLEAPHWFLIAAIGLASAFNSTWYLQVDERFTSVMMLSIVGTLAAVVVTFVPVGGDERSRTWHAAVALCIGTSWLGLSSWVMSLAIVTRREGWHALAQGQRRVVPVLRSEWTLFFSQFAATLYASMGTVIVGALAGRAQAGAYGAVERPVGAVSAVANLTHTAAYPTLIRLYHRDRQQYLRVARIVWLSYFGVALLFASAVIVWWEPVLQYFLGSPADPGVRPLMGAALAWLLLSGSGSLLSGYYMTSGRSREVMSLTLSVLAISAVLGAPSVWWFGAWGWMASLAVAQLLVVHRGWQSWRLESIGCRVSNP